MQYWLLKSEPISYSIDNLRREANQTTAWDGVRNYQARNFMRDDMKKGDLAFFYHSSCKIPGIMGVVEVVRESYVDHTAFDPENHHYDPNSTANNPRWLMVDVKLQQQFSDMVTLAALKRNPACQGLQILRKGNRLSITPVSSVHWNVIMDMRSKHEYRT